MCLDWFQRIRHALVSGSLASGWKHHIIYQIEYRVIELQSILRQTLLAAIVSGAAPAELRQLWRELAALLMCMSSTLESSREMEFILALTSMSPPYPHEEDKRTTLQQPERIDVRSVKAPLTIGGRSSASETSTVSSSEKGSAGHKLPRGLLMPMVTTSEESSRSSKKQERGNRKLKKGTKCQRAEELYREKAVASALSPPTISSNPTASASSTSSSSSPSLQPTITPAYGVTVPLLPYIPYAKGLALQAVGQYENAIAEYKKEAMKLLSRSRSFEVSADKMGQGFPTQRLTQLNFSFLCDKLVECFSLLGKWDELRSFLSDLSRYYENSSSTPSASGNAEAGGEAEGSNGSIPVIDAIHCKIANLQQWGVSVDKDSAYYIAGLCALDSGDEKAAIYYSSGLNVFQGNSVTVLNRLLLRASTLLTVQHRLRFQGLRWEGASEAEKILHPEGKRDEESGMQSKNIEKKLFCESTAALKETLASCRAVAEKHLVDAVADIDSFEKRRSLLYLTCVEMLEKWGDEDGEAIETRGKFDFITANGTLAHSSLLLDSHHTADARHWMPLYRTYRLLYHLSNDMNDTTEREKQGEVPCWSVLRRNNDNWKNFSALFEPFSTSLAALLRKQHNFHTAESLLTDSSIVITQKLSHSVEMAKLRKGQKGIVAGTEAMEDAIITHAAPICANYSLPKLLVALERGEALNLKVVARDSWVDSPLAGVIFSLEREELEGEASWFTPLWNGRESVDEEYVGEMKMGSQIDCVASTMRTYSSWLIWEPAANSEGDECISPSILH